MRLEADGPSASLMRPEKRDLWPLVIGYGLYLCIFLIGPLGTATLSRFGSGSTATLFSRALMIIGTILMLLVWKAGGKDDFMHDDKSLCLSYGGLLVSYAILYVGLVFGLGDISVYAFSLVFGLSSASLKLTYYEGFFKVLRKYGRSWCVIVVAGCFFVAVLPMPFEGLMSSSAITPVLLSVAAAAISAFCSWMLASGDKKDAMLSSDCQIRPALPSTDYVPPLHMRVIMLSFGFVWAVCFSLPPHLGFSGTFAERSGITVFLAGILVCGVLLVLFWRVPSLEAVPFGLIHRTTMAVVGALFAFMPFVAEYWFFGAIFVYSALYVLINILMIVLIMEICSERNLTVCAVTASNYSAFIVGACVSLALFAVLEQQMDIRHVCELLTAIGVSSMLFAIPLLPARASRASDLTRVRLPEEVTQEELRADRIAALKKAVELSVREEEVFDLLLEGLNREQIAQELSISAWTAKNHAASIYKKLGIHSREELKGLIS